MLTKGITGFWFKPTNRLGDFWGPENFQTPNFVSQITTIKANFSSALHETNK